MLDPNELTVHTLTLRQLGSAEQLAEINALPIADVEAALEKAVADGAVMAARGNFMITPAGREFLDDVYARAFAGLRADPAVTDAMDSFETGVNKQVLTLTTDWQTIEVDGARVSNDHADATTTPRSSRSSAACTRRPRRSCSPWPSRTRWSIDSSTGSARR